MLALGLLHRTSQVESSIATASSMSLVYEL